MAGNISNKTTDTRKEPARAGKPPFTHLVAWLSLTLVLSACSPEATAPELLDRAMLAMERGDIRAAEIDVRTALQQSPEDSRARNLLGEIYFTELDPVAAAGEFERSLRASENEQIRIRYAQALLEGVPVEDLMM